MKWSEVKVNYMKVKLHMKSVLSCKCDVAVVTCFWYRFTVANVMLDNIINVTSQICYQNYCKNDVLTVTFCQRSVNVVVFVGCGFCMFGTSRLPSLIPVTPWDLTQSHLIRPEQAQRTWKIHNNIIQDSY